MLAEMPLHTFANPMKLLPLPSDDPLKIKLHARDLFSTTKIQRYKLHDASWTMDFSILPEEALGGIEDHNQEHTLKRRQDDADDGDSSGDYVLAKRKQKVRGQ